MCYLLHLYTRNARQRNARGGKRGTEEWPSVVSSRIIWLTPATRGLRTQYKPKAPGSSGLFFRVAGPKSPSEFLLLLSLCAGHDCTKVTTISSTRALSKVSTLFFFLFSFFSSPFFFFWLPLRLLRERICRIDRASRTALSPRPAWRLWPASRQSRPTWTSIPSARPWRRQ